MRTPSMRSLKQSRSITQKNHGSMKPTGKAKYWRNVITRVRSWVSVDRASPSAFHGTWKIVADE